MTADDESRSAHASGGWILYDGGCGFCSRWVRFWQLTVKRRGFAIKDLQSASAEGLLQIPQENVLDDIRVLTRGGELHSGANAYLYMARRIWWAWPFYAVFSLPGLNLLLWWGYKWFNRNRYRISKHCSLPSEKIDSRSQQLQLSLMKILISAGEASGEMYGAELIGALRRTAELRSAGQPGAAVPSLDFFGVGGERMRAAGCDTVVDAKDLSVVGITEILSRLPKILGLYQHLIQEADQRQPDLAIVIDSPAFNWRVARQMKKRGIPVVYYVAPQFWAWRQGRVRLLRDYIDKALVIFPFEEKFYRDRGVDATFVGHPLAELPAPTVDRPAYAAQHGLNPQKHWITLMPGSRVKEVRMNLPTILEAAVALPNEYEYLLPVAPTLDRAFLKNLIGERRINLVADSLPALWHSRAGIIASGTATVEAAMMRTPFVMVYRVSALTYMLGKPRVKVPYFAMVNLIAGQQVVPELVQQDFTAEKIVAELGKIIPDGPARQEMLAGLDQVKTSLRVPENRQGAPVPRPADRAAEIILTLPRPARPVS